MADLTKLICFDTETTGLSKAAEILQLSIVDGTGQILFNELIKPSRATAWPEAERVHHITPDMVADKPEMSAFRSDIEAILAAAQYYIGYNVKFDLRMLKQCGISMTAFHRPGCQVIDVMQHFAPIYGEWNASRGGFCWKNLETCAAYYNYDWGDEKAHGALADTKATLYCFKKMKGL
ncbi:MAG: 3'-5' exonuclease [Selenomonadaceae bacterium]|nr:3'-5' exonuclease [Selenomonadaceae bacterium]